MSARSRFDQILLPKWELSDELARKGRVISFMSLGLPPFAVLFGILSIITGGFAPGVVVMFLGAAMGFANVGVVRAGRIALSGRVLTAALMLVVLPLAWLPGAAGLFDPSQMWSVVTPVVALFAVSMRAAIAATGIHVASLTALYIWHSDPKSIGEDWPFFQWSALISVILAVLFIAWAFESSRRSAARQLELMADDARNAAHDLRASNLSLDEARAGAERRAGAQSDVVSRLHAHQDAQSGALDNTAAELSGIVEHQRAVAELVDDARTTTAASTRSAVEMMTLAERASARATELAASTAQATDALAVVARGGNEVASKIEQLSNYAESTRRAMEGMRASIGGVEQNAESAEVLAETVISSSQRGTEAVARASSGMEAIRESSRAAGLTMGTLGERIESIDQILAVIQDVADETQLLSLNASIIASQAGEQGRAFSVVATEIKKLASRTSSSAGEIASLIQGVQAQSRAVIAAISESALAVSDGLTRSRQAERALEDIVRAALETTTMVKSIATLTVEQSTRAAEVVQLATQVAGNAQDISTTTSEHAVGINQIDAVATSLRAASSEIEDISRAQREGNAFVATNMARIDELMAQVHAAQAEQTHGVERILSAVETIREAQRAQARAAARLEEQS